MATLHSRLAKLEQARGVRPGCPFCAAAERLYERLQRVRVIPAAPVIYREPCFHCHDLRRIDVSMDTPEMIALHRRARALYDGGRFCTDEMIELQARRRELWPARRLEVYGPAAADIEAQYEQEIEDAYVSWGPTLPLAPCLVVPCRCIEQLTPEKSAQWQRIFDRAEQSGAAWLADLEAWLKRGRGGQRAA